MDIPTSPEQVTPEWLTDALRSADVVDRKTRVSGVTTDVIGQGVGLMGLLLRLTIDYDRRVPHAPRTAILKLPPVLPENRAVGDFYRFFEREARFYQQLAPQMRVGVPRCYWSHVDVQTDTFALLLEDLGRRCVVDQIAGADEEHARAAVRAMATLHGTWWESPALRELQWLPTPMSPMNLASGQMYRDCWPSFVERFGDVLPEGAFALGQRVQQLIEGILLAGVAGPQTLVHGDYRLDNLYFDLGAGDRDKVVAADWQICGRGVGAADLAYFVTQSLAVGECERLAESLLHDWYDQVAFIVGGELGYVPGYDIDRARNDYRLAVLFMTVFAVVSGASLDLGNERGRHLVREMTRRAFCAALAVDGDDLYDRAQVALVAAAVPQQRVAEPATPEPAVR